MKRYNTADLRKLQIINICDGSCLGFATDFEFEAEPECGRMIALVIGGSSGFFGLGRRDDLVIPWRMIECIGEDAILVKINKGEISSFFCPCRPKKKGKL